MEPIDKTSPIPYYLQLAEMLRRDLAERCPPQQVCQLPSENELATLHGITRTTVRRALDVVERDGWIYRQKGKGSFAAVRRVEHDLTQLVSTTEYMRERGWLLTTRVVSLDRLPAPPEITRALDLPDGAPCYRLCRLRVVDGEPISVQTSHLPAALCPNLEDNDLTGSLYRLLEARYDLRLWTGREILRARCTLPYEQQLLAVPHCTPVMDMERVSYAVSGQAVEYLEAVWRGDRYDFKVSLSRPQR
jgi:GntR family transcriptional regulator, N-acetylglucosamine utilization regulator